MRDEPTTVTLEVRPASYPGTPMIRVRNVALNGLSYLNP